MRRPGVGSSTHRARRPGERTDGKRTRRAALARRTACIDEAQAQRSTRMSQPAHRHFSMIRSFHLADLFTLGNAACGAAAVLAALSYIETGRLALLLVGVALGPLAFLFDT